MSIPPSMKPAKGKVNRKGNHKTKKAKRDDDVMNTNDSSIVSKRCVSKLYFSDEPDFYEPFVPKFIRRNPLINRGYWLRMHAIEQVVRRFLEEENNKKKIVVNLGCGYDPLPFQFWHRYEFLTKSAIFVDVDYPQLIEKKRDRMLTNTLLRDELFKTKLQPSTLPVYLRSEQYMAIGCDLRDLDVLERTLRAEVDMSSSSVLYVAEVSATYMPVADSDRLLRWAATSFDDARFCILEQYLPQGPDHPFAKTMLAHFKKLQASIYAVERYLTLEQQSSRFLDAGWTRLDIARNLWDLWSDDTFTSPALRQKLDAIESFDEWEEYGCYAGHYFLLVASNVGSKDSVGPPRLHSANTDAGSITDVAEIVHLNASALEAGVGLTPRRFTAAFVLDDHSLAVYGGQGSQNRLSDVDVLRREDQPSHIQPCTSPPPHARMCHTVTSINDRKSLLVGGRGSPAQAFSDCWLIDAGAWIRVDDMATARYRHSAVSLDAEHGGEESKVVLVFGGKASDGRALDDWIMWAEKDGWRSIPVDGPRPSARFGAAISTIGLNDGVGLLIGGVDAGGTVVEDVWEWTFCATPTPRLTFRERTNDVRSALSIAEYARIGASMVPWGDDSLLLIGGVSRDGIHGLSEDFVLLTHSNTRINIRYPAVQLPPAWPLLVGAGVVAVSRDEIVIAGGGAVCFSMGSFWNQGCLTVTKADMQGAWRAVPYQVSGTAVKSLPTTPKAPQLGASSKKPTKRAPRSVVVPRVTLQTPEHFAKLSQASKPAIIEGQTLGPCVDLWTTDYLKEKIGPDHELVVHECSSDRMTFKDKNFTYVKKSTSAFLNSIENGSPEYLRAVSSTQPTKLPTKLEDDFPSIAADFHIPELFEVVKANSHSSPLRISGPVSLWLHYDVLSNILCQIRGTKTLHLFPPSDVKYLSYPPGGSSSNTDIHTSKDPKLRFTHPHIASLKPNDILFIPPMWSHTATPQDGISVAVNVFWRDLEKGYAAGKDVYGNRDLQAYENGRRDVEKIVRAFKDVPADISSFYLDRLAGEIQDASDKVAEKARKKTT